jgi:hypothetical protein
MTSNIPEAMLLFFMISPNIKQRHHRLCRLAKETLFTKEFGDLIGAYQYNKVYY